MALTIKDPEIERLVTELSRLTGDSKTEIVRLALLARKEELSNRVVRRTRGGGFLRFLEEEIWPQVPPGRLGRRLSKAEKGEILGYGHEGV